MSYLPRCQLVLRRAALFVASVLLCPVPASAVFPVSKEDDELAKEPIIVVARWNKAPFKNHDLIEAGATTASESETHTELVVERVLRGDVKPGKHKLLVGSLVSWMEEGGPTISYTSTMLPGPIEEVAAPNVWFLSRQRSWDREDKHEYLHLATYDSVQPLALEPYFQALISDDPPAKMAGLLRSREPIVVRCSLRFVAGGDWPWPMTPPTGFFDFLASKAVRPPVAGLAAEVERLLDEPRAPERPLAVAVYARFAGTKSLPRLRKLLDDKDSAVRAAAIALLARQRDGASCDAMRRAAVGIDDGLLGCAIVEAIGEWKDERLVPLLIGLLQNDDMPYMWGDDWHMPAIKAQQMLKKLVGCTFPLDVKAGLKAWEEAKDIRDPKARQAFLTKSLPFDPQPLKASYSYVGKRWVVTVTNKSPRTVTLSKLPAGWQVDANIDASSFVSVGPRASTQFEIDSGDEPTDPTDVLQGQLMLAYTRNGNRFGVNAWIGTIEAEPVKTDAKGKTAPKP